MLRTEIMWWPRLTDPRFNRLDEHASDALIAVIGINDESEDFAPAPGFEQIQLSAVDPADDPPVRAFRHQNDVRFSRQQPLESLGNGCLRRRDSRALY